MTYKDFLKRLERGEDIEYTTVKCPFLIDHMCSIYNDRKNCCRNFPNKNGICAEYTCLLENNDSDPSICTECGNTCCKRIVYPKDMSFNLDFLMDFLDMDCETCSKFFDDYELDE